MAQAFLKGGVAVITGGASGIGRALANKCHSIGMRVVIADCNEDALDTATKSIGTGVTGVKMDVGNREDWELLSQTLRKDFGGQVNLLALNAGKGAKSPWSDPAVFEDLYRTNIMGVVNGISAILPLVEAAAGAGAHPSIVITGSKQGITNPPGNPAYNSSKAAVKSIAEHLSWDLRKSAISVHLLVPGWTFTGMTGNKDAGAEKPNGAWWPEQVVDYLVKKMAEGQFWVICPDDDVSEELDKKRITWSVGELLNGRPPLSRWREDLKDEAQAAIDKMEI